MKFDALKEELAAAREDAEKLYKAGRDTEEELYVSIYVSDEMSEALRKHEKLVGKRLK